MAMGVYVARTARRWTPVIPPRRHGAQRPDVYVARTVLRWAPCLRPPAGDWRPRATWRGGGAAAAAETARLLGCGIPSQQTAGRTPELVVCTTTIAGNVPAGILRPRPARRGIPTLHVHMVAVPPPRLARIGGDARPARHAIRSGTVAPFRHASPVTFRSTPARAAPCATYEAPWGAQGERLSDVIRSWAGQGRSSSHFSQGPLGVRQQWGLGADATGDLNVHESLRRAAAQL